jgi:Zn ribbon nucleic-acid-binding protein
MNTPRSRRWLGSGAICARCGSTDAIEIRLQLNNDMQVDFHSCHRCEHRWWDVDGEVIDLTTVLELARQR